MSGNADSARHFEPEGQKQRVSSPDPTHLLELQDKNLWHDIQERIKQELGMQRYGLWFHRTELLSLNETELVVGVPNITILQFLERRYKSPVAEVVEQLTGQRLNVRFDVAPRLFRKMRAEQRSIQEADADAPPLLDLRPQAGPAEKQPTGPSGFDRLVVTECNLLVSHAAREIALSPQPRLNFLLICGGHGLGKTTYLKAICEEASTRPGPRAGSPPRIEFLSAEDWYGEYYYLLRKKRTRQFMKRFKSCDLLVIDDLHLIEGKPVSQEELASTIKCLLEKGKRVVFASAKHPDDLQDVKPSLLSLLRRAFWAILAAPPPAERKEMVEKLAELHGLKASAEVHEFLTKRPCHSVQDLVCAVRGLAVYAAFSGGHVVDLPLALRALAAMERSRRRRPTLEEIEDALLEVFPVSRDELRSRSRARNVSFPRQIACYLARTLIGMSLSQVGRHFGGRTHSTVKHSVDKIIQEMRHNKDTASLVESIKAKLQSR